MNGFLKLILFIGFLILAVMLGEWWENNVLPIIMIVGITFVTIMFISANKKK